MPTPVRRLATATIAATLAATLVLALAPATAATADDPTTGTVAGTLTDGPTAVADAAVDLVLPPYGVSLGQTRTDAAGRFRLGGVRPATYTLRFTLPGGLVQFHPGVADIAAATQFAVAAGQDVTIDEAVMAHGTLGGRITTDGGAPAAGARVRLNRTDGPPVFTVLTDANGDYRFAYPPAGRFRLAVAAAERGATDQWAHRQRTPSAADPVVITAGQHTTVDERLLPVGAITGRFTRDGVPVANVVVQGQSQASAAESVSNFTAADGTFRLRPYPGSYKLKFVVPAGTGLDQWAGGAESEAATVPIRVEADGEVVLDERQLPTGRVSGRLTDAAGAPVARAAVVVADPSRDREFLATTDDDGRWFHTVWPGRYTVRFETGSQVQWATGAGSPRAADPVAVSANGETVVDDALRQPGALTVTAVDARTGAPVASFCADVHNQYVFQQGCTSDGAVDIPVLGAGSYEVVVTDGVHQPATRRGVRVFGGRRTAHVARLAPAGTAPSG
jgi:hypothetical protein